MAVKKTNIEKMDCQNCCQKYTRNNYSAGGPVYGMGVIGSLFYFIQRADGINEILLGIVKAIIWPGMLAYKLLEYFKF